MAMSPPPPALKDDAYDDDANNGNGKSTITTPLILEIYGAETNDDDSKHDDEEITSSTTPTTRTTTTTTTTTGNNRDCGQNDIQCQKRTAQDGTIRLRLQLPITPRSNSSGDRNGMVTRTQVNSILHHLKAELKDDNNNNNFCDDENDAQQQSSTARVVTSIKRIDICNLDFSTHQDCCNDGDDNDDAFDVLVQSLVRYGAESVEELRICNVNRIITTCNGDGAEYSPLPPPPKDTTNTKISTGKDGIVQNGDDDDDDDSKITSNNKEHKPSSSSSLSSSLVSQMAMAFRYAPCLKDICLDVGNGKSKMKNDYDDPFVLDDDKLFKKCPNNNSHFSLWKGVSRLVLRNVFTQRIMTTTTTSSRCHHQMEDFCAMLKLVQPPLEYLELSCCCSSSSSSLLQRLSTIGCLADTIVTTPSIANNLKYLNLESTGMDTNGAVILLSKLGQLLITADDDDDDDNHCGETKRNNIDIRITKGNPLVDMTAVALRLAAAKHQAESRSSSSSSSSSSNNNDIQKHSECTENGAAAADGGGSDKNYDDLQKTIRHLLAAQATMVSDLQALQKENKKLKQDGVLGGVKHVGEWNSKNQIKLNDNHNKNKNNMHINNNGNDDDHRRHHPRPVIQYPSARTRHRYPDLASSSSRRVSKSISPARLANLSNSNNNENNATKSKEESPLSTLKKPPPPPSLITTTTTTTIQKTPKPQQQHKQQQQQRLLTREEVRAKVMAQMAKRKAAPTTQNGAAASSSSNSSTASLSIHSNGGSSSGVADRRAHILKDVHRLKQEQQARRQQQQQKLSPSTSPLRGGDSSSQPRAYSLGDQDSKPRAKSTTSGGGITTNRRMAIGVDESGGPEVLRPDAATSLSRTSSSSSLTDTDVTVPLKKPPPPATTLDRRSMLHRTSSDRFQRLLRRQLHRQSSFQMLPAVDRYRTALQRTESNRSMDGASSICSDGDLPLGGGGGGVGGTTTTLSSSSSTHSRGSGSGVASFAQRALYAKCLSERRLMIDDSDE